MPKVIETQLRHSKYYALALRKADELYMRGGSDVYEGLRLLDLDRENTERGQAWAGANLKDHLEAASLCLDYALGGRNILV